MFAPFLAESRALLVIYKGQVYFPTLPVSEHGERSGRCHRPVGRARIWRRNICGCSANGRSSGFSMIATRQMAGGDAQKLAAVEAKYPNRGNYVIMPPIPWDPYQSDFWYNEILNEIQVLLTAGDREGAERTGATRPPERAGGRDLLGRDRRHPCRSNPLADGRSHGLARSGTMPSLGGLAVVPPNAAGFVAAPLSRHGQPRARCRLAAALRLPHFDLLRSVPRPDRPGDRNT